MSAPAPIWRPSADRVAAANITRFAKAVGAKYGLDLTRYADLHRWSAAAAPAFWREVAEFTGVKFSRAAERTRADGATMLDARWFIGARLNFAENLLATAAGPTADKDAIVFYSESGERASITYRELAAQTKALAQNLRRLGTRPGDRVVGYLPNQIETIAAALATAAVGAVWSACSPDFGADATRDRFAQIAPKALFATPGYLYNGKWRDRRAAVERLRSGLPTLEHVISTPYPAPATDAAPLADALEWETLTSAAAPDFEFEQIAFDAPLYILYSSGTTGAPKCIVHGAGGTLLQHRKEHALHTDIGADDRVFYFTTCGWMMWHWLTSALASGATIVLYDGSPFYPDADRLWSIAERERLTVFGASASYISALKARDCKPKSRRDLSELKTILSTGSPLSVAGFETVYQDIKSDVCLSSISGGSDIISCFALGAPILPVYAGEIQCIGLGMDVAVFDERGRALIEQKGELVCRSAFPSMPVGFWNDPRRAKYKKAYFERYENVWTHGDFAQITARDGVIIYGRSDATLNPSGVRIGTAEIYRQIETLSEIADAAVVGKATGADVEVVLFVVLRDGLELTGELKARIKRRIRDGASPRHVPQRVERVGDIPRTLNGKVSELAIKAAAEGRAVANLDALANPESLRYFKP